MNKLITQLFLFTFVTQCYISLAKQSINDFSNLNQTYVNDIIYPKDYTELANVLNQSRLSNTKISIAGKKHSMGGHAFYKDTIVIDTRNLNKIISLDLQSKTVTVQTGVTWKELQNFINPLGLSVKVMQYANILTIGGALSVNANGLDLHQGPIIQTVRSIKVMLANSKIVKASRTENKELFSLAIGGYELFGIILEAEIALTENLLYKRECKLIDTDNYSQYIYNHVLSNKNIGFHTAQIFISPYTKKRFPKILVVNHLKTDLKDPNAYKLNEKSNLNFGKFCLKLLRCSNLIKFLTGFSDFLRLKQTAIVSRNNIMSPPVEHIYHSSPNETDILQEYFIPVNKIDNFIKHLEELSKRYKINFLHIALRFIPANRESFLHYSKADHIGVVLLDLFQNPFLNSKL